MSEPIEIVAIHDPDDCAAAEAEIRMLRAALQPFAHHSLPGFWTESDRVIQIRVTEGQVCAAWMALNNPHWRTDWLVPDASETPPARGEGSEGHERA